MKPFPFFLLIFLCTNIFAQNEVQNTIGVKGGSNFSSLTGNNYSKRVGSDYEIFFEGTAPHWKRTCLSGVGVSFQGADKEGFQSLLTPVKYTANFPSGQVPKYVYADVKKELKLNYLIGTALIQFHPNPGKKSFIKPYLAPGLFYTYLLSANEVVKGISIVYLDNAKTKPVTNSSDMIDEARNVKPDMHKFNLGVLGYIGVAFPFGKNKIFIEGGGSYSFFNLNKNTETGVSHSTAIFGKAGCAFCIGTLPWFRHKYWIRNKED